MLTPMVFLMKDGEGNPYKAAVAKDENGLIHSYLEYLLEQPKKFETQHVFIAYGQLEDRTSELGSVGWEVIWIKEEPENEGFRCLFKREVRT